MNVSVCLTVFNEEKSISFLLDELLHQTKKPDEIVVVDGGSTDRTVQIIKHYQKKYKNIKLLEEKCSRSKGRNLSVDIAKNEIIAMTDGGCLPKQTWLSKITEPFKNEEVGIAAGFYDMTGELPFQKALSVFLGVLPGNFDVFFLPSTRSVAFRKSVWEKIGGFPEKLDDTAEDTVFNFNAVRQGIKFARVKDAKVEWLMPGSFKEGILKIYSYARGDARSKVWIHPVKGFGSHNIHAALILLRYILGSLMLFMALFSTPMRVLLLIFLFVYSLRAFRKVYSEFDDWKAGLWGVATQYASDLAVIKGFVEGTFSK